MIFSPYDNASCGDESIGFLVFAISLFPIILPSATIQPFNVGYQGKESLGNSYYTFVTATFNTVDGSAMKLGDIKLDYDSDDATAQKVWTLDNGGASKDDYYYVNEAAAEFEEVAVGWYTDTSYQTPANDVSIPYGMGLALVATETSTKVLYSGAVKAEDANVNSLGGGLFYFTGNCMPVDYTLADVALIYSHDDATAQKIWTLDNGGATKDDYYYVNEAAAEFEEVAVGWYTDTSYQTPANDVDLLAGQGIAVVSTEVVQFRVPSPLK